MPIMTRSDRRTVIIGTGSCIPKRRVPNSDFMDHQFFLNHDEPLDRSDNASIVTKFQEITDIAERRYVDDGVLTTDLAVTASERAIEESGIERESLDYVIVAHNFGDVRPGDARSDICPSLAARVKQRLEIANPSCVAYDLPFGCPGWIQGVIQASYYLGSGDASRALVVGAETLSRVSDPHDRDSMLYADGAGAAVLEAADRPDPVGILSHAARSDTIKHAGLIWMGSSYNPDFEDDRLFLKMRGRKLYEYALNHVPGLVKESLDKAGLSLGDVKKILLHQANTKMDEAIVKRLFRLYGERTVPDGVMPMTISWLGNSSVATVPTLLDLMLRREFDGQTLATGDVMVLASVGAGMNVNSVVYRFP
jgi:3-oxoacyl-[acyl-carrier-protein] synthase-3